MTDAELIARARNRNMPFGHLELIDKLADALERHTKPSPADVAGLVGELSTARMFPAYNELHSRAASLIAAQAREIERCANRLDEFGDPFAAAAIRALPKDA